MVADKCAPDTIPAGDLDANQIGMMIRFRTWEDRRKIVDIVTAELRQIQHNGDRTTLVYGEQADRSEVLQHDQPVTLRPPADYSDWAELDAYDDGSLR